MAHERASVAARFVQRWLVSAVLLAIAVVIVAGGDVQAFSIIIAVLALIASFVLSPWLFPKPARGPDGHGTDRSELPVVYWRPGCIYCIRLRIALGLTGNRARWVDISRDPAAAHRVREINGGNETVPTVLIEGVSRTNPDPRWVKERLPAA